MDVVLDDPYPVEWWPDDREIHSIVHVVVPWLFATNFSVVVYKDEPMKRANMDVRSIRHYVNEHSVEHRGEEKPANKTRWIKILHPFDLPSHRIHSTIA